MTGKNDGSRSRARRAAFVGVAVLHGVLGYALLFGLAVDEPVVRDEALVLVDFAREPPPRVVATVAPRPTRPKPRGAASRAKLESTMAIVALPPVPEIASPPIVAVPTPGIGDDVGAGDAGPPGSGAGISGDGDGGGTPARWLRGRIKASDYPQAAVAARVQGSLSTRYVVGANGRVTDCIVTESSGSAVLDETTCRLIRQRFRFAPSRDAGGRAVPDEVFEDHYWVLDE